MIEQKTVLVLGAGASAPFDFPTGQRLKDLICIETLRQAALVQLLVKIGFDENIITRFRTALQNSGHSSVDAFLEYREDLLDIGKTAIAATLLPFEKTIGLFRDWSVKRLKPEPPKADNWYDLLFDTLTAGVPFDEFDENKLYIITFNYDRSIEHYLFTSLKNSYNRTDEECGEKLRKIEIIHVHGSLGPLDWQTRPAGLRSVPYDSGTNLDIIEMAAENIKIIHEDTADTPEFTQARNILLNSTQVLFLGFGYHPTNLRRLVPENMKSPSNVKGTMLGLNFERERAVARWNGNLTVANNTLIPKDVYTFLHDHVIFGRR